MPFATPPRTPKKVYKFVERVGRETAKAIAGHAVKKFTSTSSSKTGRSLGVTANYDRSTQYRKKRMPRRKRKAWAKFFRKVKAANLKLLGTRTVVFNSQMQTNVTAATQAVQVFALYGKNGDVDSVNSVGFRDLSRIFSNDPELNAENKSALFGSGIVDFTMHNTGNTQLEVDLYELYTYGMDHGGSYFTDQQDAELVTPTIAGTPLTLTTRGATPFDFPVMIKKGYKIYRKTKYFLPPGNTATAQYRNPRNHKVTGNQVLTNSADFHYRKLTKVYVFIFKSVAGTIEDGQLTVGVTRKFMYKILEDTNDGDMVL